MDYFMLGITIIMTMTIIIITTIIITTMADLVISLGWYIIPLEIGNFFFNSKVDIEVDSAILTTEEDFMEDMGN